MIDKRNGNFITKQHFWDNCSHSSSVYYHGNVVYISTYKIIHKFTISFIKMVKGGDVYIVQSIQKFRDLNVVASVVGAISIVIAFSNVYINSQRRSI